MLKKLTTAVIAAAALTIPAFAEENRPGESATPGQSTTMSPSSPSAQPGAPTSPGSVTSPGTQASPGESKLSNKEEKFIKKIAENSTVDLELKKWAQEKATSNEAKQLAQRAVEDHQKVADEAKRIASQKGITVTEATELKGDKKDLREKLTKLSGAEFDKEFAKEMAKCHKKEIQEIEEIAREAKDPDVKAFASSTLTPLRHHLEMAQVITGEKPAGSKEFTPTGQYGIEQRPGQTTPGSTSPAPSGAATTPAPGSSSSTSPAPGSTTGSHY